MPRKHERAKNIRLEGPVLLHAEKERTIPMLATEAAALLLYLYGVLSTLSLTIDWTPSAPVIWGTALFGVAFIGILHLPSPTRGETPIAPKVGGWLRWAVFGGAVLLLTGIGFLQRHALALGAQRFWLDLVGAFNQFYGTQYEAAVSWEVLYKVSRNGSAPTTLFTMAVVSTLAALLSLFLKRGKGLLPLLALSAPFLWMAVNLAEHPLGRPCLLFLAALLMTAGMHVNRARHAPAKQEGDFSRPRGWRPTRWMNRFHKGREQVFGGAIAVTALGMAVVTAVVCLFPRESYVWNEKPQELVVDAAQRIGERLTSSFERVDGLLPIEVPMGGGVSGGRMGGVGQISYTYEEKLRLEELGRLYYSETGNEILPLSEPETMYLRGYTGSVYANDHWEDLPKEVYPADGLQDLEYIGFGGMGALVLPEPLELSATIRNLSAGETIVYQPYLTLITEPPFADSLRMDIFIDGYDEVRERPESFAGEYRARFGYKRDLLSGSPSSTILDQQERYIQEFRVACEAYDWLYTLPDSEETYRKFVYANYLNVPDHLSRFREVYNTAYYAELSVSQVVDKVRADLHQCKYSLSPGKTPWYSDFVEDFLFSRRQGFCVHFAAAGTLMFRAAGIPARYVEGYVARAGDYSDDYRTVTLRDNAAHAWVEIYAAPFGWIPIEVTPGFTPSAGGTEAVSRPETVSSSEVEVSSQPVSSEPASSQPVSSQPVSSAATPQGSGGNPTQSELTIPVTVWLSLLAALLLVLGVWLRYALNVGRRNRDLRQEDKRLVAIAGYRHLEQLLRYVGITAADGQSPQEFAVYAEEHCKFLERGELQAATEAALSARFGGGAFTADQARPILALARRLDRRIWDSLSPWRRFFYRYWNNL